MAFTIEHLSLMAICLNEEDEEKGQRRERGFSIFYGKNTIEKENLTFVKNE